jgi:hypothetical protein
MEFGHFLSRLAKGDGGSEGLSHALALDLAEQTKLRMSRILGASAHPTDCPLLCRTPILFQTPAQSPIIGSAQESDRPPVSWVFCGRWIPGCVRRPQAVGAPWGNADSGFRGIHARRGAARATRRLALCRVICFRPRSGNRHAPVHRRGAVPDSEDRILEGVSQKEGGAY